MARLAWGILAVAGMGVLAASCNALLGADEPIVDLDGSTDAFIAPNCGDASVIDDGPLWVLADAPEDPNCGTQDLPCTTIARAMEIAQAVGKSVIRVGQGEYREVITLRSGITIEGGWIALKKRDSYTWYGDCRGVPASSGDARVIAPDDADVAVIANDLGGTATLSTLTIHTKPKGAASQTLYGVVARGETTSLALTDVIVVAGDGGDGLDGALGEPGAAGSGSCPPEDGGAGAPGAQGPAAPPMAFDELGLHAAAGGTGQPGLPGSAGGPGEEGSCVACCAGLGCGTTEPSCGLPGQAGCPGQGGLAGGGGQGGGGSVALFVARAKVTVTRGELRAGNGGKGGNGGLGGPGGEGAVGATGDAGPECPTNCLLGCSGNSKGKGGAGSLGGAGGPGGQGGGGAGGSSYAYVVVGEKAEVQVLDTALVHGMPGPGGSPGGPDGDARPFVP